VLFDLKTGKRRRVIQVVFGFLAFIFFISFVGFGIGSDVSGGIFDALGVGGNDSGSASSQYELQIDEAEEKLASDPGNQKALTDVARYRYLSGQDQLSFDEETGVASLTEETRAEWNLALDAWEQLTRGKPGKIDEQVATQMICAYLPPYPVCGVEAPVETVNFKGAIETQTLLAEQSDDVTAYGQLAAFYYFDNDVKGGKRAAEEALSRAESEKQRKRLSKQLEKLEKQARDYITAQDVASEAGGEGEGEPQLPNPFGGLGTDSGAGGLPPVGP